MSPIDRSHELLQSRFVEAIIIQLDAKQKSLPPKSARSTVGFRSLESYVKLARIGSFSTRNRFWLGSYPVDGTERISREVGQEIIWCGNYNELFFLDGNEVFLTGVDFERESPKVAFTLDDFLETRGRSYDVSSDGQTLFMVKREPPVDDSTNIVQNWFKELKERVPVP